MERPVDVLILTAPFGNGHNSAAQAIIEELGSRNPELHVQVADLFDITAPRLKETFSETYQLLTRSQPALYNLLYDLRTRAPYNPVDSLMVKLTFERFLEYVGPLRPRIILSVFPTGAAFASGYRQQVDGEVRLITCITDVVDSWEWLYPETDLYLVAADSVRQRLMEKGIPDGRILVTGVPVRRAFQVRRRGDHGRRRDLRLLILANAMDTVKLDRDLLRQLAQIRHLKTVIVTGGRTHLYRRLTRMNQWPAIEIRGYVQDMAALMAEADLVISKAGGATLFEAIQMELPLLVRESLVGQENHNVTFIREAGIGELLSDDNALGTRITALLRDRESIQTFRRNIRSLKRTLNQGQLAPRILGLLEPSGAPDNRVS